jgi:ribosomal protein S27AE
MIKQFRGGVFMGKNRNREPLVCPKCGSKRFVLVSERVISDACNVNGEVAAEHTVEGEKVLAVECAECGESAFLSYVEKPISEKEWKGFWQSHLSDFIMAFEHYAVDWDVEGEDETRYDAFLKGMATGMWTIYNLVEAELVENKKPAEEKPSHG